MKDKDTCQPTAIAHTCYHNGTMVTVVMGIDSLTPKERELFKDRLSPYFGHLKNKKCTRKKGDV